MAKLKSLLAICLALVLVFSPVALVHAEGPGDVSVSGGPTDGGEGHPWDDGTTEQTDPGEDTDVFETNDLLNDPLMPFTTFSRGFGGWIEWAVTQLYTKVTVNARATQKRGSLTVSPKKRGSLRVVR
jgi:hypothetical protein